MTDRIKGFKGEYLWELDIAEQQLTALAETVAADRYDWRPVEDARSVSEVLVHIAAGNLALLDMKSIQAAPGDSASMESPAMQRFLALVMKNQALEQSVTAKADVTRMLQTSFAAVRDAFNQATPEELERPGTFFGEQTTVRRVFLRILAHTHEHMGQIIAYVRVMGLKAPWPDPREWVRSHFGPATSQR